MGAAEAALNGTGASFPSLASSAASSFLGHFPSLTTDILRLVINVTGFGEDERLVLDKLQQEGGKDGDNPPVTPVAEVDAVVTEAPGQDALV